MFTCSETFIRHRLAQSHLGFCHGTEVRFNRLLQVDVDNRGHNALVNEMFTPVDSKVWPLDCCIHKDLWITSTTIFRWCNHEVIFIQSNGRLFHRVFSHHNTTVLFAELPGRNHWSLHSGSWHRRTKDCGYSLVFLELRPSGDDIHCLVVSTQHWFSWDKDVPNQHNQMYTRWNVENQQLTSGFKWM